MKSSRPICLTIAGFDPSGGAGVLADIKTFEQFRVQGFAVQTANTVQTEDSFSAVNWISKEIILQQLKTLLKRYKVKYFKIGLIENAEVLLEVLTMVHSLTDNPFIIWDPVLSASAGGEFNTHRFEKSLPEVLAKISVVTPNLPEYKLLFAEEAPQNTALKHKIAVYLKGGHSETEKGKDFYYFSEKVYAFNPTTRDKHSQISEKHGSGCVLSSALLAVTALDYPVVKGTLKAKNYVERFLASGITKLGFHSSK